VVTSSLKLYDIGNQLVTVHSPYYILRVDGYETWAMTEQMTSALKTWERKILRKIYGLVEDQNGWRIRTNDELQVMYRKPNVVTTMKVRRLEWDGHLLRLSDDGTVKNVFLGKPDGRKKAGRPK
jgi:hypothetical protein